MAKTYRTIQGDTFDLVAFRLWKDEQQCGRLMEANADFMDVVIFPAGIELNVPDYRPKRRICRPGIKIRQLIWINISICYERKC